MFVVQLGSSWIDFRWSKVEHWNLLYLNQLYVCVPLWVSEYWFIPFLVIDVMMRLLPRKRDKVIWTLIHLFCRSSEGVSIFIYSYGVLCGCPTWRGVRYPIWWYMSSWPKCSRPYLWLLELACMLLELLCMWLTIWLKAPPWQYGRTQCLVSKAITLCTPSSLHPIHWTLCSPS